jgi:hypothetical protein
MKTETSTADDRANDIANGQMEAYMKLTRDLKASAKLLGKDEIRFLVDFYYTIQQNRIRADAQVRGNSEKGEPSALLVWAADNFWTFENNIKSALDTFTQEYTVTRWARSICGIGPVISAGFVAHFNIEKAPTYGHFWRFAGLDATVEWEKKTRRPWNAALKTLVAFKLGESFVKVQNNEKDYYGQIFVRRKARELEMNMNGKFADQAKAQLGDEDALKRCRERKVVVKAKRIGKDTEAYKHLSQGMLPPAQIHARARRYAVKLFLSHLHHVMFEDFHGRKPLCPYPFEKLAHDKEHYLPPPNWPFAEPGKSLKELKV